MTDITNQLKINVKHRIGAEVKHQWNDLTYKVIGYQFIQPDKISYICLQPDKTERVYFAECELKSSESSSTIGFYTEQDTNDQKPRANGRRTYRKDGDGKAEEDDAQITADTTNPTIAG